MPGKGTLAAGMATARNSNICGLHLVAFRFVQQRWQWKGLGQIMMDTWTPAAKAMPAVSGFCARVLYMPNITGSRVPEKGAGMIRRYEYGRELLAFERKLPALSSGMSEMQTFSGPSGTDLSESSSALNFDSQSSKFLLQEETLLRALFWDVPPPGSEQ
ncbi:unnamed protein product, partial [Symbiodinium sp. KB8]